MMCGREGIGKDRLQSGTSKSPRIQGRAGRTQAVRSAIRKALPEREGSLQDPHVQTARSTVIYFGGWKQHIAYPHRSPRRCVQGRTRTVRGQ